MIEGVITQLYAKTWVDRHYPQSKENERARNAVIKFAGAIDRMLKNMPDEDNEVTP
jgi:hypothetical protein